MTDRFSSPDEGELNSAGLSPEDPQEVPTPDFHWEDEPTKYPWEEDVPGEPVEVTDPAVLGKTIQVPELSKAIHRESGEDFEEFPHTQRESGEDYDASSPAQNQSRQFFDTSRPATVVSRPEYEKRSTGRKVAHAFGLIGKYLVAIITALAIAVMGFFGYLTITEYNPAHAEIAQRGAVNVSTLYPGKNFRIVTFNTGYAGLDETTDFFMDGGKTVNPDSKERITRNMLGIESILKDCDADFYFLQEVDTDSDRSFGVNQWLQYEYDLESYESRYGLNYSCNYVPYPLLNSIGKVHSGVATYSRYDISSATRYSLPCPFTWPTRIANLKRCMLVTRIPIENQEEKELVLVNFHLEAYDDGEGKEEQTRQLLEFIQEEYAKGNYVIAGGDFNQVLPGTLDTYPIKDSSQWQPGTLESLPEGWQYAYDSYIPTCRLLNQPLNPSSSLTQYYIIDGFIVSPNLKVEQVQTLDEGFVYSDHNPVVLDVSIAPPAEETPDEAPQE